MECSSKISDCIKRNINNVYTLQDKWHLVTEKKCQKKPKIRHYRHFGPLPLKEKETLTEPSLKVTLLAKTSRNNSNSPISELYMSTYESYGLKYDQHSTRITKKKKFQDKCSKRTPSNSRTSAEENTTYTNSKNMMS